MYIPNPGDIIQAVDAKTGDLLWEYKRALPQASRGGTNRTIAIWGTTIIDGSSDNQMYAIDARTGKLVWETPVLDPKAPASAELGADHRQRQGHPGTSVSAAGDQRRLHHHRARCEDGQGAVAHAHDPAPWRTGQRDVGRRAAGAALARRHVDGAQLRRRAEPGDRRHVGDDPGAEVHPRRQRQAAPVSQLDARPRRRHRQDRLVLPAHRRSLGSRSSVRAAAGRHRGRARSEGSALDQSAHQAGRAAQGGHRHPGQDRHRLYARSQDRRVPVGTADGDAERDHEDRRRDRQGHRQSRT